MGDNQTTETRPSFMIGYEMISFKLRTVLISGLLCLASCGGGEPSKAEVKKILIDYGIQTAFLFQDPTQQQRDQASANLEKKVDVQGLNCKPVEGFKKVWDCTVNYMVNGVPNTDKMRLYRTDKGDLAISNMPNKSQD